MFSNAMKSVVVACGVLGVGGQAVHAVVVDNFDSYSPGASGVQLVGQGNWVSGYVDGITTVGTGIKILDDYGVGNTDAAVIDLGASYQHAAIPIGNLPNGGSVSVMFQVNHPAGFAEFRVGDSGIAAGGNGEIAMWVQAGLAAGNVYGYGLYTDEPGQTMVSPTQVLATDNSGAAPIYPGGTQGHTAELRLTLSDDPGISANGLDTAHVEVRSETQSTAFVSVGTITNSTGIGFNDLYIAIGGESGSVTQTLFDNLDVTPVPEPATACLLLIGGLALFRWRHRR